MYGLGMSPSIAYKSHVSRVTHEVYKTTELLKRFLKRKMESEKEVRVPPETRTDVGKDKEVEWR